MKIRETYGVPVEEIQVGIRHGVRIRPVELQELAAKYRKGELAQSVN